MKIKLIAMFMALVVSSANASVLSDYNDCSKGNTKGCQALQKACAGGDAWGCFNLGYLYENGRGVKLDYFKASRYYQKACAGGLALGCNNLGVLYYNGQGVRKNTETAKQFFGKACDLHCQLGCTNYARLVR